MSKAMKAVPVQVTIAGIDMRCYRLPNGSIALAGRTVTDAINKPHKSLTEKMGVKTLKALPKGSLSLGDNSSTIDNIKSETGESFVPVSTEAAVQTLSLMVGLEGGGGQL